MNIGYGYRTVFDKLPNSWGDGEFDKDHHAPFLCGIARFSWVQRNSGSLSKLSGMRPLLIRGAKST